MTASLRFGLIASVDPGTYTAVVTLDGVDVTAHYIREYTPIVGNVAPVVQDGRRLVIIGPPTTGAPWAVVFGFGGSFAHKIFTVTAPDGGQWTRWNQGEPDHVPALWKRTTSHGAFPDPSVLISGTPTIAHTDELWLPASATVTVAASETVSFQIDTHTPNPAPTAGSYGLLAAWQVGPASGTTSDDIPLTFLPRCSTDLAVGFAVHEHDEGSGYVALVDADVTHPKWTTRTGYPIGQGWIYKVDWNGTDKPGRTTREADGDGGTIPTWFVMTPMNGGIAYGNAVTDQTATDDPPLYWGNIYAAPQRAFHRHFDWWGSTPNPPAEPTHIGDYDAWVPIADRLAVVGTGPVNLGYLDTKARFAAVSGGTSHQFTTSMSQTGLARGEGSGSYTWTLTPSTSSHTGILAFGYPAANRVVTRRSWPEGEYKWTITWTRTSGNGQLIMPLLPEDDDGLQDAITMYGGLGGAGSGMSITIGVHVLCERLNGAGECRYAWPSGESASLQFYLSGYAAMP